MGKPVLPVNSTVGVTYRDAWRALQRMPVLALAVLVAFCALQALRMALGYAPTLASRNFTLSEWIWFRTVVEVFSIAGCVVLVPLFIGVQRWLLLDETAPLSRAYVPESRYRRYLYYTIIFSIPSYIITLVSHAEPWGTLISVPLYFIYVYLAVRGCLIFSAVAIDRHQTGFVDLFKKTKGNFWRVFMILLVAMLPTFALAALTVLARKLDEPTAFVAEWLLSGIGGVGGSVLMASANSHIYRVIGSPDWTPAPAPPLTADAADLTA